MLAGGGADSTLRPLLAWHRVAGLLEGGLLLVGVAAEQLQQALVLAVLGAVHDSLVMSWRASTMFSCTFLMSAGWGPFWPLVRRAMG